MNIDQYLPVEHRFTDQALAEQYETVAVAKLTEWAHASGYRIDTEHEAWPKAVGYLVAAWRVNGLNPVDLSALTEKRARAKTLGKARIEYDDTARTETLRSLLDGVPDYVVAILRPALVRRPIHPIVYG